MRCLNYAFVANICICCYVMHLLHVAYVCWAHWESRWKLLGLCFLMRTKAMMIFLSGFYLHRLQLGIEEPKSVTTFRQPILEARPQAHSHTLEEKWALAYLLKWWEKPIWPSPLAFLVCPFGPHIKGHFQPICASPQIGQNPRSLCFLAWPIAISLMPSMFDRLLGPLALCGSILLSLCSTVFFSG